MEDNNTMGKLEFILTDLYMAIIIWCVYSPSLFRCVFSFTYSESKLILLAVLLITHALSCIFEMRNGRNGYSILLNEVSGYGIYTVFTYIQIIRAFIIRCLSLPIIISAIYALIVMCRKIKNKKNFLKIIGHRFAKSVCVTQIMMGIGMATIMLALIANYFLDQTILNAQINASSGSDQSEQTIANNMEILILLDDETWDTLTVQQRLNVLQTVANIEGAYLGLPNELNVGAANLEENDKWSTVSCYSDTKHQIQVSLSHLLNDTSWEMVEAICHEAYHSYQYRLIDVLNEIDEVNKSLILFKEANSYAEEFENYVNGYSYLYYTQDCETDARDYAEDAVSEYYRRVYEYIYGD